MYLTPKVRPTTPSIIKNISSNITLTLLSFTNFLNKVITLFLNSLHKLIIPKKRKKVNRK